MSGRRRLNRVVLGVLAGALLLPAGLPAAAAPPAPGRDPGAAAGVDADLDAADLDADVEVVPLVREPASDGSACPTGVLDRAEGGRDAIAALGEDIGEVAAVNGRSAADLRAELRRDDSLHVDSCGRLFHVDDLHDRPTEGAHATGPHPADAPHTHDTSRPADAPHTDDTAHAADGRDAPVAEALATPPAPLADTFRLHSRPGSKRTIYLDFRGSTLSGTAWNGSSLGPGLPPVPASVVLPPYDLDGAPSTFSDTELATIQAIWQHVAEDYAPFDVNVTTQDPGAAAITRSGLADEVYGTRAAVTSVQAHGLFCPSCAGLAFRDVFDEANQHARYQPALIFTQGLWGGHGRPQAVADTISHEVGHNFDLEHHVDQDNPNYSPGQGFWGPIMGSSLHPLVTWSNGDYRRALTDQDDVATIADNGAPLVDDDHGDDAASATALAGPVGEVTGVIGSRTDGDWFRFTARGRTVLRVEPAPVGPNLDLQLRVTSADGATVLATVDPRSAFEPVASGLTGLDAEVELDLPVGEYRARVTGVGAGDPKVDGYSDYGSLGRYTLSLVTQAGGGPLPPAPVVTITSAPSGLVTATSASVSFAADLAPVTFECRMDAGAWQPCTSPHRFTGLGQGSHTAAVRATKDGVTSTPASRTWTVDSIPPTVTITAGPRQGSTTTARDATFRFEAGERVAGFEWRLDASAWQPLDPDTTGIGLRGLAPGRHTFEVRARDQAGNVGTASRSWTILDGASGPTPPAPPRPPSGAPTFADVPPGHAHAATIRTLASRGVTLGCGDGRNFCPDVPVSREQMATFLMKALGLAPGSGSPPFRDVEAGSTHAPAIDAMRREAITVGCGGPNYCPRDPVRRDQMATFLMKALELAPGSASPPFRDVAAGSTHARAIDAVRREDITLGCGGPNYCPGGQVTRGQMASFLVRALEW